MPWQLLFDEQFNNLDAWTVDGGFVIESGELHGGSAMPAKFMLHNTAEVIALATYRVLWELTLKTGTGGGSFWIGSSTPTRNFTNDGVGIFDMELVAGNNPENGFRVQTGGPSVHWHVNYLTVYLLIASIAEKRRRIEKY